MFKNKSIIVISDGIHRISGSDSDSYKNPFKESRWIFQACGFLKFQRIFEFGLQILTIFLNVFL